MALQRKKQIILVHSLFLIKKSCFRPRLNIFIFLPILRFKYIFKNILSLKPHVTLITSYRNVISIEYTGSAAFVLLGVS